VQHEPGRNALDLSGRTLRASRDDTAGGAKDTWFAARLCHAHVSAACFPRSTQMVVRWTLVRCSLHYMYRTVAPRQAHSVLFFHTSLNIQADVLEKRWTARAVLLTQAGRIRKVCRCCGQWKPCLRSCGNPPAPAARTPPQTATLTPNKSRSKSPRPCHHDKVTRTHADNMPAQILTTQKMESEKVRATEGPCR